MIEDAIMSLVHRAIGESPRIQQLEDRTQQIEATTQRLEARTEGLEATTHRHGLLLEAQSDKIDRLIEVVMATHQKVDELGILNQVIEWHTNRMDATDEGLRRHIRNRRAHRSVAD